ncbi:MAG: methyl viologen-reducing hydrogenase [Chloroflexi bacterium]|nr:methyl viologen-reducing hydrogenase [Chloroflexota bacterium]
MAVKVAQEWFAICGGCEVTILDVGEPLLDVLPALEFVHMPVIMDHKLYGQTGEEKQMNIPEAEVGIITGGVRNEENKKLAELMRSRVNTLIAMGSCASFGGIPALANQYEISEIYERVYRGNSTTDSGDTPQGDVPALLDRVYALHEVVKVDLNLPGCPTTPDMFVGALMHLLKGTPFAVAEKSVCDSCPTIREKKAVGTLKRPLEPIEGAGEPLNNVRCLMEQGFLCLGPATRAGCGGMDGGAPRCIKAYMPCRGCYGPLQLDANPMVDMMGALSTIGLDPKQIPDRAATFNRFAGAGRLQAKKARK